MTNTKTAIQWTDVTWSPVVGCSRVSAGCAHCYAERVDHRLRGAAHQEWKAWTAPNAAYNVRLHPERLEAPLHWRKPRRVFVNSMSDLFHELVPDEFIDRVFAVMALSPQHTFQILTKRPERMRAYVSVLTTTRIKRAAIDFLLPGKLDTGINNIATLLPAKHQATLLHLATAVLANCWLGISAEDQATADARIPVLLATPAAVRFVSYEPALGPVDFEPWLLPFEPGLDWVICGGESGPGARPFDIGWARDTIAQCRAAEVPVFMKQCGAKPVIVRHIQGDTEYPLRLKDSHGASMDEWPADLRIRQFPGGAL